MQSIYHPKRGIKSSGIQVFNLALAHFKHAVDWLQHQGAELVSAGCTEFSVALPQIADLPLPWIDPLDIAADLVLGLCWDDRVLPSLYPLNISVQRSIFSPLEDV